MIRQLFNKLGTTIYVQIWEHRLKITDMATGNIFDQKPLVALQSGKNGKSVIVAFGDLAAKSVSGDIELINPFSHQRVLFSNFMAGELLLQKAIKELLGDNLISPTPAIVLHPMEKTEGGLTMIEVRAFRELAAGAGGRDSVIYQGRELSVDEINFKSLKESAGEQ